MRQSQQPLPFGAGLLGDGPMPTLRRISAEQSATWLERGFSDFIRHPGIGLTYGALFAMVGWLVSGGVVRIGMGSLLLPLACGFLLMAPFLAVGLYEVSRRSERGEPVSFGHVLGAFRRNTHMADMGLVLLMIFFAWSQAAMIVFALFFGGEPPSLQTFFSDILSEPHGTAFLVAGSVVGLGLAGLSFSVSVVAIPMLLDRPVSALFAMRVSLRAVWLNRLNMIGWAATLALLGGLGMSLLFVGLAVTLPIAAHASWHAYRDMVAED